jgi:hypothetical protein
MKTWVRLYYLAKFYPKWEMFQRGFVKNINTHCMLKAYFPKTVHYTDNY